MLSILPSIHLLYPFPPALRVCWSLSQLPWGQDTLDRSPMHHRATEKDKQMYACRSPVTNKSLMGRVLPMMMTRSIPCHCCT